MTDNRSGTTAPHVTRLTLVLLTSTMLSGVPQAMAQTVLPTGGSVAAGSATIGTPSNGALTVTQSSASAVVNWQSFSVGQGNAVNFVQPSSTSAILNRVTGSATSTIAGQINANGQVFLVNPNGIAITSTGTVNAAGFVASTLGISDSDFMSGKRTFTGNGASASVTNNGTITIGRGGYAALLGGSVDNAGTITVPLGKVGLGSGEQATLDLSGDGFMQVAVPTNAAGSQALVSNSGKISANGGSVQLSAAAARNMARQAINMSGTIEAKSVGGRNGAIILGGSDGAVAVSGKLNVASRKAKGGSITVTGRDIKLAGATLDASGKTGGGTINVGGDRQGQGPLQRAQTVSIDSKTAIKADAKQTGNGGNVVVWSDNLTTFAGHISARGGALSGHGGEAEVSGKAKLDYTGLTDLSAANGSFGNLLLDPYNVIISNGVNNTGGSFDANTNDSVINATTLSTQLGLASVAVTTGSGGSQLGNITVAAPVSWSAPTTLTLNAANAISVNAPINVTGAGGVSLTYNTASPANLTFATGASLDYGATNNGGALSINGQAYTLLYSMADVGSITNGLSGKYALATNLDASPASYASAVVAAVFNGTLEGLGNTISNLTITGNNDNVGLIGRLGATGTIRDLGLVGGSVSGYNFVGGLVGYQDGGTISNAYATGAVSGDSMVGGLVGYQSGTISNAYATGAVNGSTDVGGLVGKQDSGSAISNAHATGAVSGGTDYVGGLVGYQESGGTIGNAYATGAVNGTSFVGGLVGSQNGGSTISSAYATGTVSGTNFVGGLVGIQNSGGTISNAYATGAVSGTSYYVGGLVGYQDSGGTIGNAYATGAVNGTSFVGGLVGYQNGGTISNSYWDIQTSGQSSSAGGTGLTTAAFQSGGASRLGSAFSGGANGLYPYLTSFYPNGVQALSGFAYTDSGVTKAASGLNGPQYVYIDIAGKQTAVTTGANGYYYLAVADGTLSLANGGTATLAYTLAGNVTGPVAGAHLMAATGTTANVDIWGHTLIAPTTATMLSAAPTDGAALLAANGSANQTLLAAALGNDTAASGVSNLSLAGYVATGAGGFTIDQGITANGLYVRTTNGPITVASAQTLGGPINLELLSAGALAINAPINVNGAGSVTLAYDASSPTNLTFATGASVDYGTTDHGGTLSINGQAYTLLYSLRDIENINNALSGTYALATSLDAAGTTYTTGVVAGGGSSGNLPATAFSGTFEGLGQTIANLTINGGSYVGLFGYSTGTIRDIGLTGASVNGTTFVGGLVGYENGGTISSAYATGAVSGATYVGGLVGYQNGGTISSAYATGAVSGTNFVGGLVGYQGSGSTISNAYATGAVSGTIYYVGGLVGLQDGGAISNAYATGAVNGTSIIGGLVGYQSGGSTISNAYATGAVSGTTNFVGGLVGYQNGGTISNAYATGAVSGYSIVGGLVGYQDSGGTISNAYATGAVSGTGLVGGLVGIQNNSGTISNSYWDIQTSGQSWSAGGTGLTTAAFQSGGASRLGSAFSGGANGLYPYLTSFYPNGVQALSGFAYTDSGVTKAASGLNGPQYVYIDIAGKQTAVTTGANGYYYVAVADGTLSSANGGTATLAYTLAGNVTGPVAGAHLMAATGTTANVDIWGHTLIAPTTATMLSAAPTDGAALLAANGSANQTLLAAALGNDTAASGVSNLSLAGYVATGAGGFTIDQGITANGLYARTTNGPITVSSAQTLGGPINLELISAGALAINAPITVNGAGSVTLAYDASSPANLTFATGASVDYGATDHGGTLSINGQAYTLLYSMTDVGSINSNLGGNYALATSLNAAGTTYTTGVVAGGNSSGLAPATAFSGTFEGLGQTIANLTINGGSNYYVGLFGYSTGTIRDIGLTGGSVSGTSLVGGLVGFQYGGTISNAYATGAVSGTFYVGGLVGYQDGGSTIGNAYATGSVSGTSYVGGLVGYQDGGSTIGNAYATGSVSGTSYVGGLVGFQNGGTISNAYATGAVSGTSYVGGLVGYQSGGSTISNAYATGAVNGTGFVGGLVGDKGGTISNSYWDIQTSGQSSSAGGTGLTTAQMRDPFTFINAGWDLANVWGKSTTGANGGNMMLRGLSTGLYDDYVQVMGNTSKIYGDANPTLSGLSLSGLGTANVTLGWASGINAATGVGIYSYTGGGVLLVTDVPSRTLYVDATGTLSITPRAITVTADAQSRAYGNANPALTYAIGGGGLVNGDALTGGLATAAGATSNVGSYAITQGSLAASSNYAVSYVGADLAVTQRALMLTADAKSRSYGDANPALTYAIGGGGLVNGDALNGALATAANSGSAAGSYAITRGTLSASANYSMTFVPGTLTVNAEINPPTSDLASTVVNSTPPGTIVTAAMLPATFSPPSGSGSGSTVLFADPRFDGIVICGGLNCVVAAP